MKLTSTQRWGLIVTASGLAVAGVMNLATGQLPEWIKPYLWLSWPLLGALVLLFLLLSAIQAGKDTSPPSSDAPSGVGPPAPVASRPTAAASIPEAPEPYFAHPYPLQENFTGRVRERKLLTEWLTTSQDQVLALIALGGMGKSALTWVWLHRDVLGVSLPGQPQQASDVAQACRVAEEARPDGVLWWSFYDREASFGSFLNAALRYASGGEIDPAGTLP